MAGEIPDQRRGLGTDLHPEGERVRLLAAMSVRVDQLVLVVVAVLGPLDHAFPDTGRGPRVQPSRLPVVEVADHAHAPGVRRPDGEAHPALDHVRAEDPPSPLQLAVVEEVEILLRDSSLFAFHFPRPLTVAAGVVKGKGHLRSKCSLRAALVSSSSG
jgi:hypothetical protein